MVGGRARCGLVIGFGLGVLGLSFIYAAAAEAQAEDVPVDAPAPSPAPAAGSDAAGSDAEPPTSEEPARDAASAEDVPSAEPAPGGDFECGFRSYRLDGARVEAADDASFNPDWLSTLERIAQCVQTEPMAHACVAVQGRFDDTPFDQARAPVTVLGGDQAAQNVRARGRAGRVLSHLFDLGIDAGRLRELPPPAEPSYRGVEVRLEELCFGSRVRAVQAPVAAERTIEAGSTTGASSDSPASTAPQPAKLEAMEPPTHRFWVGGELGGQGVFRSFDDVLAATFRVGGGWQYDLFYARAALGASVANEATHRAGFGFQVAAGFVPLPWLQTGAVVAYDVAAPAAFDPWSERHWSVGIEAAECVDLPAGGLDLCFIERLGLLGRRSRRAVSVNGQVFRVPEEDGGLLTVELGLSLRREL